MRHITIELVKRFGMVEVGSDGQGAKAVLAEWYV
jgi:hypothetical protein